MSGTSGTIEQVGMTSDVAVTTPDATSHNVPSGQGGASGADMLTQSEWTRRLVAVASVIVVSLSVLLIVTVMCYRVFVDGNAPLTNDITTKLMWLAIVSILSMVGALFHSNALTTKLIGKVLTNAG